MAAIQRALSVNRGLSSIFRCLRSANHVKNYWRICDVYGGACFSKKYVSKCAKQIFDTPSLS